MSVDFAFIDSGTGGIPYLVRLKEICPSASCVYVGDTENFPYGEKSHDEVVKCVLSLVNRVREKCNPKVIVMACNTMSVNALDDVRAANPDIQFVGTVPAIKLAASVSKKRRIGLLATNSTVRNPYTQELKNSFAFDCQLICRGDPDLISFVEHKYFTSNNMEETKAAIKPAVDFFRENDCDVIILGCTHFLNIADEIQEVAGDDITVVDSRDGVVNHALVVSGMKGQGSGVADEGRKDSLFVTGFSDKDDENEYNVLTKRYGLEFLGKL